MADTPDDLLSALQAAAQQEPLDEALAGLHRIANAAGIFRQTWTAASISEVCDMIAAWCRDRAALLAEKDAQIARLAAELDDCRNVTVELVPTAGIEAAMAADPDREDGVVLREMGGQKRAWAWRAATREWEQVT